MALSTLGSWAGFGVPIIANWAGSAIVENLVNTAYSYLLNRMLPADSEAELKRLQTALPQITAVMGIAEALKMKYPNTSQWVEQFRQALEASEEVLDELEYKKLEDMVKPQDEAVGSAFSSKEKKLPTFSLKNKKPPFFSSKNKKPGIIKDGTLERLKKAVTMLDQAAAQTESLLQLAIVLGINGLSESWQEAGEVLRRETTSFLAEREVFGREVEKHKVIDWLKRPTDTHLTSFGIVGVGGVGKTTLVQFAYKEMRGSNHFDKTIWICVSTNFIVEDITRKILSELGENHCCDKPLNALQESLKETIHSKKVLFILDDVWDDERQRDWEQLIAPLRFVQKGSKILFTTRMKSVASLLASVISTEHESLALQGLHDQELRLLFNSYAFHGFNLDNHIGLQAIGDKILTMLRGSPLAAKVIGSLLNSSMDDQYWRRILNHGSIFNLEQAKDVVDVLKLSYYHLPVDLQVCFRFCSIFPQDHKFDKNELIKMWIACGFIRQQSSQSERPEDIGEDYFNLLLRKSFFEYAESSKGETRYVMHDLMHELAQKVSYGECCRIEPSEYSITIPNTVRHVFVHESEIEKVLHLENLHCLIITTNININPTAFVFPSILAKKSLRLLKLYVTKHSELPKEIGCLIHLRYLSIEQHPYLSIKESPEISYLFGETYSFTQSFKYSVPASIYKLYHLQVLELPTVYNNLSYSGIETTGMTNLLRLRYMRLPDRKIQTIHGIHKLTSLQELTFPIDYGITCRINELGPLNNLRHLSIKNIGNIENPAEAKGANLLGKTNLISLSLGWNPKSRPPNSEQIIDYLQPHSNLKELTITNYKGHRSPSWMEESTLSNLSSLKIYFCPAWSTQLFSLKMPYLKNLNICYCGKMHKLPDIPLSLIKFRICDLGLTSLPDWYQSGNNKPAPLSLKSSLRKVHIEKCNNLTSLDGFMLQYHHLQATEDIIIYNCEKLLLVPIGAFGKLLSLKHLSIQNCPNLTKCPSLPLSLTKFRIGDIGVSTLPIYNQSSDSRDDPSTLSLKSSLGVVEIKSCSNLKSLDGFLDQDNIDFQSIEVIEVSRCVNLVHLPVNAFQRFVPLTKLIISDCPMLAAVDNPSNLLPVKLKLLVMINCGVLDVPLLESASHLTNLTDLLINNCENISRIPSSENAFRSLNDLRISECKKLVHHSSMEQAHGVNKGSNLACLKLSHLEIDNPSLLLIEPLRSLISVSNLLVKDCSGMEALPEQWLLQNSSTIRELAIWRANSLKSLPATMERLTVLERLEIPRSDALEELPVLPVSLRKLVIKDARSLKSLPATMARLTLLEELEIRQADLLEKIPELPASLKDKKIQGSGGQWL